MSFKNYYSYVYNSEIYFQNMVWMKIAPFLRRKRYILHIKSSFGGRYPEYICIPCCNHDNGHKTVILHQASQELLQKINLSTPETLNWNWN